MQPQTSRPRNGIHVATGFGLKVQVHHGHLVVHQGVGHDRIAHRFHRATSKLKRLVVVGHRGYITLEALRWLQRAHANLIHLDTTGRLVTQTTGRTPDLTQLRRAQALAATSSPGVEIARTLLADKLHGQHAVTDHLPDGRTAAVAIDAAEDRIDDATEFDELLSAESAAASAYWEAWATVQVNFAKRDQARIPEHWRTAGPRHSPLSRSPRLATTPAHAILNYLYALLEAETVLACHAVGLDPGIGIFHTDTPRRDSLALDLMEAARPAVDAYTLWLIGDRTLRAGDFVETPRGACRLAPLLADELAQTLPAWTSHAAPVAERTAQLLADRALPTTQTNAARVAAWDGRRRNSRDRTTTIPDVARRCTDCGAPLTDPRRRICDECRRRRAADVARAGRVKAADVLGRLRGEGRDPAHGGKAARARGSKNAQHQRAVREWNARTTEVAEVETYRRDILPGLRDARIGDLVAATGLSEHYCSLIRLGKRIPHARHWDSLSRVDP